jgi:hypothetical protein
MRKRLFMCAAGWLVAVLLMLPAVGLADQTRYEYDRLGRLTLVVSVSAEAIVQADYQYDDVGNRIAQTIDLLMV